MCWAVRLPEIRAAYHGLGRQLIVMPLPVFATNRLWRKAASLNYVFQSRHSASGQLRSSGSRGCKQGKVLHAPDKPDWRAWQADEALPFVERRSCFILGVEHEGKGRDLAANGPGDRVHQQHPAEPDAAGGQVGGEPAEQRGGQSGVAG